jgi:hypothetical protein
LNRHPKQSSSFHSAALLKAILKNQGSHVEASKSAKTAEANLKQKIEELEGERAVMARSSDPYGSRKNHMQRFDLCMKLNSQHPVREAAPK